MTRPIECGICGVDRETILCNGCPYLLCLDCLKHHESNCIERNGDRTACDSQAWERFNFRRMGER